MSASLQSFIEFSPEVSDAFKHKQPILALESTIITHGLPYPHNQETALLVHDIARQQNVVPATIAIINGKIKIGLQDDELATLIADQHVLKASTRDLSFALSRKLNAGTTVAATLFCAALAGIKVFATGGMGGVHRGDALDISADLIQLARTPMAMVCAGAKAILDIPKTLELLETLAIPVIGYQTKTFPAFYTHDSPYDLTMHANTLSDLILCVQTHLVLQTTTGVIVANPIPKLQEIASDKIAPAINEALAIAAQQNIIGKAITPFLLAHIAKVTAGKSLTANIELIANNVKLGAAIARAL